MPPPPVFETLILTLFSIVKQGAHRVAKRAHKGRPGSAKVAKCRPKVSKMEPKWGSRPPPNPHPCAGPQQKGAMCDPYIICYVSTTSALPEKVTFSLQWAPQSEGKIRSATEVAKKRRKRGAKGAEEKQRGAHGGPTVGQGLQNDSQILPKFVEKRGLGPGAHPKGAKGTPGPPKSQKSDEF